MIGWNNTNLIFWGDIKCFSQCFTRLSFESIHLLRISKMMATNFATTSQSAVNAPNQTRTRVIRKKTNKRSKPQTEMQRESEQAVKYLTRQLERKTCPQSLQYRARAHIRADNQSQKDIKQLRFKAEKNYGGALIRLHNRRIDSLRSALHKQKRIKNSAPTKDNTVTRKPDFARSALSRGCQKGRKND